jgi:hypothetical protein
MERPFHPIEMLIDERDWTVCRITDGVFEGACGPLKLAGLLAAFLDWAAPQA